jgi:hypothetical protein
MVDNLELIYQLNILEVTYSDEINREYTMAYISAATFTEKSQEVCEVYLDMNNAPIGSTIRFSYEVIMPMTAFNILTRI